MTTQNVIVYSAQGCVDCSKVKDFLTERGIPYEVRDLLANREYQEEVEQLGFMGIPVTAVGGRAVKGFDPDSLKKLLGIVEG